MYKNLHKKTTIIFLLLFFIFAIPCIAQKSNKGFLSGAFQFDIPKNTTGLGVRLAGGININHLFLLGLGVGVTKIQNVNKAIIPVFAHFALGDFKKKVFPYFVAEPGYGFYDRSEKIGNERINTKGGFNFFGGGGMGVVTSKSSTVTFSVGYSVYNFETKKINSTVKGLAFKISVIGL